MSKIEWTDRTWNPIVGCNKVSNGCKNCYAERMAARQCHMRPGCEYEDVIYWQSDVSGLLYPGHAHKAAGDCVGRWNGKTVLVESAMRKPLHWRKPSKVFVTSMGDLFLAPETDIDRVFAIMAACPQHTFQLLTKRPHKACDYLMNFTGDRGARAAILAEAHRMDLGVTRIDWPLKNVWLGTSVENQEAANERIPWLLQSPAAVRFLSIEPMLGPVDLSQWIGEQYCCLCKYRGNDVGEDDDSGEPCCPNCGADSWYFRDTSVHGGLESVHGPLQSNERTPIDWVIVGGESGPGARPMNTDWPRSIRDQCAAAGVPFLFKQWGEWDLSRSLIRVGKKAAGRLLDGVIHDAYPPPQRSENL